MNAFLRTILLLAGVTLAGGLVVCRAVATPPVVQWISPFGLVPGESTRLVVTGQNLDGATALWTSFGARVVPVGTSGATEFSVPVEQQTPEGLAAVRVVTTNGLSAMALVIVDRLPTRSSVATNRSVAAAQLIQAPGAVEGAIEPLGSRFFRFVGKKGERLSVEVVARRLGSPLDPWLRLVDPDGREIAFNDDAAGLSGDARIDFSPTRSGEHLVELRDTRFEGSARHRFRLRIGPALPTPLNFLGSRELGEISAVAALLPVTADREPNDDVSRARMVELPGRVEGRFHRPGDRDVFSFSVRAGDRLVFSGRTRSLGFAGDVVLRVESTNGVVVAESNAGAGDGPLLTNRFDAAGIYRLVIEELNGAAGERHGYEVGMEVLGPGFSLSTATERISLPAGEKATVEVRVLRRDFSGPIRLNILEPTGFLRAGEVVLPAGTNVARIELAAPADALNGEHRLFGIVGRGTLNGSEIVELASTLPALSSALSGVRWVPRELDGILMFSVSEESTSTPAAEGKGRKRRK